MAHYISAFPSNLTFFFLSRLQKPSCAAVIALSTYVYAGSPLPRTCQKHISEESTFSLTEVDVDNVG